MKIGIDFDDVLVQFDQAMLDWHNKEFGTSFTREEKKTTRLVDVFQASFPETVRRVLLFYKTMEHAAIVPIDGAQKGVKHLAKDHTLYIVTARPEESHEETNALVQKFFPGIFTGIYFTNHFVGEGKKKSEACKDLGVELFIDDSLENAVDVASLGIPVFLLDAPWNREETPKGIKRVYSWDEIVAQI